MHVSSVLRQKGADVASVGPDQTIAETAALLSERRIGAALVLAPSGDVLGVISERDIVRGIAANGQNCLTLTVRSLMTENVISCGPDDKLDDIMSMMTEHRIRHLPVMDGGRLAGIISIGDVVKNRVAEIEMESKAMREYIASA
ncbi:MAG: CBS domain-containing protein [Minwuiales bacterium]|nr:CBS domain-containing protein [Minwuiales bacterium]